MKTISREAIIRMTGGARSSVGGGVGGGNNGMDLSGYALQSWVDENYLSIAFFRNLFRAYESDGTTEVLPNGEGTTIDNIKAMFGFWTDQYLSALGQNSSGGGGGGGSSTLSGLNDVQLGTLAANDVLTYDGSGHWVNTPKATLLSGYATQSWVTGTALTGYATQSWVGQQGFLTSVAFADLTSHPTTLSGYGITDALVSETTFWGRAANNGVVSGDMTGVGSITMSGFLYLDNGKTIYFKDTGGTYRNAITFNTLNDFAIGYHIRLQGYTTDIQGGKITFGVGTTRIDAFEITNSGLCYVKSTQGLRIGNGLITWDSTNNALKVSAYNGGAASIYALGGVSALGYTTGDGGGGAAALTDLADVTITSPTAGQILVYDGTGHWQNVTANYLSKTGGSMTGNIDFGAERGLIFDIDSSIRTGSDNYLHINAYEELVLEVDNHEWLTINTDGDLRQNDNYESGAYAKLFFDSTGYNIGVYGTATRNSIYLLNDVYCSANVEVTDDLTVYGDIHGEKFYLDNTHYIYLDNGTLKYYDGSTSKTVVLQ